MAPVYAGDFPDPFVLVAARRGGGVTPNPGSLGDTPNRRTSLWGARLSPDGLSLAGPAHELLRQDRHWEAPAIEAPSLVAAAGAYWLFYSAGPWESASYCVGYAVGAG